MTRTKVNAGEVLAAVQADGFGIVDVSTREADLEDVFLKPDASRPMADEIRHDPPTS